MATEIPEKTEKKIKIVWTSFHNCIRVVKLVTALKKTGRYSIHGIANQVSYGTNIFDTFHFYHNKTQFDNLIKDLDADIFIHSNEPNDQVNWIRAIKPNAKIILDGHDFDSVRQGFVPMDEMRALTNCDGVLFVSNDVRDYVTDLHKDQLRDKPVAVLEHYCNEEWHKMPMPPITQRHGLVYQGGAESPPYKSKQFQYRHLYPVLRQLVNQGNEVHLMPGNKDAEYTYADLGCFVYAPKVYPELMSALRTKKYGLCVFNNPKLNQRQVNLTRTNKEQEYLSCGLPVIVCGAPATAKYIKENDVGLVFDKLEDIVPEFLEAEYPRVKASVDKIMPTLTMERHIHILEKLIQDVLKG